MENGKIITYFDRKEQEKEQAVTEKKEQTVTGKNVQETADKKAQAVAEKKAQASAVKKVQAVKEENASRDREPGKKVQEVKAEKQAK